MDHSTHVSMAYKLLESSECDKAASIYSLLPAIDREPAHFHRVHAHIISNFPKILSSSIYILADTEVKESVIDGNSYEYQRIKEDKEYFEDLMKKALPVVGDNAILQPSSDLVSAGLALLSHIYFDTFNNPVQAFLPESPYASGQWNFWANIGYLNFREKFYSKNVIQDFRERLFNDRIWNTKLDPFILIKCIIIRMGDLSRPGIEYEIIDNRIRNFLRFLDCNEYLRPGKELQFCKKLEQKIEQLIAECLKNS